MLYGLILTLSNSLSHAVEEFFIYWYWIVPLIIGFGIQAGLYSYIRISLKARKDRGGASAAIATAGGISTTSMVACCAHHVTDVLPLVGLSAAVVLLNQFQSLFFLLGIVSNTIGVILMLKIIQQHNLYSEDGLILALLMRINMKKALYISITFGAVIILITLYKKTVSLWRYMMKLQKIIIFLAALLIGLGIVFGLGRVFKVENNKEKKISTVNAEARSTERPFTTRSSGSMNPGDVLIELTPKYIAPGKLIVKFAMNTHTIDLS